MTDWAGRVQRLEAELSGLREAMRNRGLIEQAKGRLAERWGVDAEQAFKMLSQQSQEANLRVVDVAAQLMGSPVAAEPVATDAEPLAVGAEPLATGAEPLATGAEPVPSDADPVLSDPSRGGEDGWIGPLVDVLDEPVLVLSPLWTDSTLNDFRI